MIRFRWFAIALIFNGRIFLSLSLINYFQFHAVVLMDLGAWACTKDAKEIGVCLHTYLERDFLSISMVVYPGARANWFENLYPWSCNELVNEIFCAAQEQRKYPISLRDQKSPTIASKITYFVEKNFKKYQHSYLLI
jgi:hypothetical protein